MRKLFKVLAPSLLALVGVMAASASAAQAKWLLLKNGTAVSSLNIVGSSSEGVSILVANGIEIRCGISTSSATVTANEFILTGTATVAFNSCVELTFLAVCGTHSTGQPNGSVVASGKGTGGMVSVEEVYLQSGKELFTTIEFTGEECPLAEINGATTGEVKITALTALKDTTSHMIHTEVKNLTFGEEAAIVETVGGYVVLGTIKEATGATFAVHLIGL
jgi:hypothetical protein